MEQLNYRFKEGCNEQFVVESLEDITDDVLMEFVTRHQQLQRPRLEELKRYYLNQNRTILERENRKEGLANNRLCHAYARYVSSFMQGYLVGNEIKVTHPDERVNAAIQELNIDSGINRVNAENTLDNSIYGRAFDLVYRGKDDKCRVVLLDAMSTFVIYDDTVDQNYLMGVRYRTNMRDKMVIECYTATHVIKKIQTDLAVLEEISREQHAFGMVPITEHKNNRFRTGDYEHVLDQIDAYDAAESDTANYMTDFNEAYLAIMGNMDLSPEKVNLMKDSRIIHLIPSTSNLGDAKGTVDVKYVYKQYDVAGSEAYKNRLQNDIHKFTNTPDMNDEKFAGNNSGVSMQYKLFGLEQLRSTKQTLFTDSAIRRYKMIFNLGKTTKEFGDVDLTKLEFIFTPNIPKSFYEEVKAFTDLGGQLSQETILTLTALVKDAKEEMKKIQSEQVNGSTLQARLSMNQNAAVFDKYSQAPADESE